MSGPALKPRELGVLLREASRKALGGGVAGALAMVVQVLTLMWMRTTINFQHAKGLSTGEAMTALYAQGGLPRFYQGIWAALLQAPISRFGDTASNAGMLAVLAGSRHHFACFQDYFSGVERFASRVSWTHGGAATTHSATIGI